MIDFDEIRQVPGFAKLSDVTLQWLVEQSQEIWLEPGAVMREEGSPAEHVFILLSGEFWITQRVGNEDVLLKALRSQALFGEVPTMMGLTHFWASGRAVTRCHLLELPNDVFWHLLGKCSTLASTTLKVMTDRIQEVQLIAQHRENLVSLGTLAAGLAHELNNPAAASRQAARQLREVFPVVQRLTLEMTRRDMTEEQQTFVERIQQEAIARVKATQLLDPMTQSDREDEVADWLLTHAVKDGWKLAPTLVAAGIDLPWLERIVDEMPQHCLHGIVTWLDALLTGAGLLDQLDHTTQRIFNLVDAVQDYSEDEPDGLNPVDIHEGLESTLTILHHKLKRGVTVIRDYAADLPAVPAYGTELNQVWTNLIDNAIDATMSHFGAESSRNSAEARLVSTAITIPDPWRTTQRSPRVMNSDTPTLWIRTRQDGQFVLVEIADNGMGISPEIQPHIFEPFFTTKGVGQGMGVGLQIVHRIVERHHGDIRVQSMPGDTRFQVRLPAASC